MLLLQGGTQTGLCSTGNLIGAVSEQGISIYILSTGLSKGFCTLSNTVSADITPTGVYICTITDIYFLALEDIAGDSTGSLQLLSITPPNDIVLLCAEKHFLVFCTASEIVLVNLADLSSRLVALTGITFLATYSRFIAFSTNTVVYTFCYLIKTFSLLNCYTPTSLPEAAFSMSVVYKFNAELAALAENVLYLKTDDFMDHCVMYFGEAAYSFAIFLDKSRSFVSWYGFSGYLGKLGYIGLDGLDNILENRKSLDYSFSARITYRPYNWVKLYKAYRLETEGPVEELKLEYTGEEYYTITINNAYGIQPNDSVRIQIWVDGVLSNTLAFTLLDESRGSFRPPSMIGQAETATKLYTWIGYWHHRSEDAANTYYEPRCRICIYNKITHAVDCIADTIRSNLLPNLPDPQVIGKYTGFSAHASFITTVGSTFYFADKNSDHAEWLSSDKYRAITAFKIDDSTDTFTELASEDLYYSKNETQTCTVFVADSFIAVRIAEELQILAISNLTQITYDITAIALGPGLAIADKNVGIHYMGITGFWKRLFTESEEVVAMDIGRIGYDGDKLAYSTSTYGKVIDL